MKIGGNMASMGALDYERMRRCKHMKDDIFCNWDFGLLIFGKR
jgi:hypothetical protein